MTGTYTHTFDTPSYKGTATIHTGLFIDGKFVDPVEPSTIDVINPATGKTITKVSLGSGKDVDIAVAAARKAYKTSWGYKVPGAQRGAMLNKLADLLEKHKDEFAALEALDVGKGYYVAQSVDVGGAIAVFRYYAGWADKIHGKSMEGDPTKLVYSRHEPIGVVGQIIPWNFPLVMLSWKLGPALATGNTIILKPAELTPLTALRIADLINEAGFPPGVVNIVNGYGSIVGQAISEHLGIDKVAFTGSTLVGRKIMEAAAKSNLKRVTLELGGKSPNIIFNDADLDQAVKWASRGIFFNMGQACVAGSRIYVQEGIYDEFLAKMTAFANGMKIGEPFDPTTMHGPQISDTHLNRIMGYIESGKQQGATVHTGGVRHGKEGYFVTPTIFTNTKPHMKIVREEIFGPVGVVIKFKDEADVIEQANDTSYGLAAAVFTQNINTAINMAHALEAGTTWVNCIGVLDYSVPVGGYKQSGFGRELGEYALENYTSIKGIHINTGLRLP